MKNKIFKNWIKDNLRFIAAQCFFIWLGVKWKKFGIFINSALAYFSTGKPLFSLSDATYPWVIGNGTTLCLNVVAVGQTFVQSWSVDIRK